MTQFNVDQEKMVNIAKVTEDNVASVCRTGLTNFDRTVNEATEKENWKGESAENFLSNYNAIKRELEQHVAELEALPNAISKVGNDYRNQEEENTQAMSTNDVRSEY